MVPGLGVTYDAPGDTTNDGTTTYTYDAENRIATAVNSISGTSSYVYDADGKRVEKTTSTGGTVDFLYDTAGREIAQVNSAGTWTRGEIYAGGRHLATLNNNATYYNHGDWLGTERARSTSTGTLYETCTSLPFGDWLTCVGGDPSPMHFTGKERDNKTGLDNFGARYDSSQFGRFMTPDWSDDPDPVPYGDFTDPQTLNLYAYVRNNSLSGTDDDGHDRCGGAEAGNSDECQRNGGQWIPGNLPRQSQRTTSSPPGGDLNWDQIKQGVRNIVDVATQATHDVVNYVTTRDPGCMANATTAGSEIGAGVGLLGLVTGPGDAVIDPAAAGAGGAAGYAVGMATCKSGSGGGGGRDTGAGGSSNENKTADKLISEQKKGSIRSVFPGQYLNQTLGQIRQAAKSGISDAQTALKLLTDSRFNK